MTEKRFKVEKEIFDGYCIVDNTIDGYYTYEKQDLEKLCDSLNELNDECEFLKIENESLEDGATKYAELCHKSLKENEQLREELSLANRDNDALKEENKLLQKTLDDTVELLDKKIIYGVSCKDKPTTEKNKQNNVL